MRKLAWIFLLPFVLLFAQQGELRHAYGHYAESRSGSTQKKAPDSDTCSVCLAYAHLSGTATSDIETPPLLAQLSFHWSPAVAVASAETPAATPRSRGPPTL